MAYPPGGSPPPVGVAREIHRLGAQLAGAGAHQERRVDVIRFLSQDAVHVSVQQVVNLPRLGDEGPGTIRATETEARLVSLGPVSKTRFTDLVVTNPDGTVISPLQPDEVAYVLARIVATRHQVALSAGMRRDVVTRYLEQIIRSNARVAKGWQESLTTWMTANGLSGLATDAGFDRDVTQLVGSTSLLVIQDARPGERISFDVRYDIALKTVRPALGDTRQWLWARWLETLMRAGLLARPERRRVQPALYRSYDVVVEPRDGVRVRRAYWDSTQTTLRVAPQSLMPLTKGVGGERVASAGTVLASRSDVAVAKGHATIELEPEGGLTALLAAILSAAIVVLVILAARDPAGLAGDADSIAVAAFLPIALATLVQRLVTPFNRRSLSGCVLAAYVTVIASGGLGLFLALAEEPDAEEAAMDTVVTSLTGLQSALASVTAFAAAAGVVLFAKVWVSLAARDVADPAVFLPPILRRRAWGPFTAHADVATTQRRDLVVATLVLMTALACGVIAAATVHWA